MPTTNGNKIIAELDASGQVSITFAQPEAYLMERLVLLGELRLAVHNACEAEKAEVEMTWQAGIALAAQRRATKAGEAPGTPG